jgi:transposase
MSPEQVIQAKFQKLAPILNEQQKRLWAATEAIHLGYGGVSIVQRATNLSRSTIHVGINELSEGFSQQQVERIRRKGGGRDSVEDLYPGLLGELQELLALCTRGDPMQPLLWTSKSADHLTRELHEKGYVISDETVARVLHKMGYSLQSNRKSLEGAQHPGRDAQFQYINEKIQEFQTACEPVISIDTKKKELIGNFKNNGKEWCVKGQPLEVNVYDFEENGRRDKAIPYGIYDITWNTGWVNVGVDHDTAEFAVESIRRWWSKMGESLYPNAEHLLITADSGGSNSSRNRLWKVELQKLANETDLNIVVCHLPPGTSKWNKIEHRLFCHITKNWRARPLINYEVVVNLIRNTKTKQGLKVDAELDKGRYPTGKKVGNGLMRLVNIAYHKSGEKWNYTITPRHGVGTSD